MTLDQTAKILIVEDEMIIATDISILLTEFGFEVVGICTHAEQALQLINANPVDMVIMDIALKGEMDGIEASDTVHREQGIPVIFLTSNSDSATFRRALATNPHAFVAKPFDQDDLIRTVSLTWNRVLMERASKPISQKPVGCHFATMDEQIFVRHHDELVKVQVKDILFIQADRSYCYLYTKEKKFLLSATLLSIASQLPNEVFIRIHRSYVVNVKMIDAIGDNYSYVMVEGSQLPVSRRMKDMLLQHLRLL